jgi:hypothetical protein
MDVFWTKQNSNFNSVFSDSKPRVQVFRNEIFVAMNKIDNGTGTISIFKMDKNGNIIWLNENSKLLNSSDSQYDIDLCVNDHGIFITYITDGAMRDNVKTGIIDIVIAKININNGEVIFVKQTSEFNTINENIKPKITCNDESIFVTFFTSGIDIQTDDIVVIKMKYDGFINWVRHDPNYNTSSSYKTLSISANSTHVFVSYESNFKIHFLKYNKNGIQSWRKQGCFFNTQYEQSKPSIKVTDEYIYMTFLKRQPNENNKVVVCKMNHVCDKSWLTCEDEFNVISSSIIDNENVHNDPLISLDVNSVCVSYWTFDNNVVVFKLGLDGKFRQIIKDRLNTLLNESYAHVSSDPKSNFYCLVYQTNGLLPGKTNNKVSFGDFDTVVAKIHNKDRILYEFTKDETIEDALIDYEKPRLLYFCSAICVFLASQKIKQLNNNI